MTSRAFRARLARRAKTHRVALTPELSDRLEVYFRLLARWNAKVNLTSLPLDEPTDATVDRLLMEPLAAARFVEDSWSPWFDIGSGGGSPAIPLKLARPVLELTMVESKARKAAFLREAVRELGLSDVTVATLRLEELAERADSAETAELVTVRGVRPDDAFLTSIARLLRPGGHLLTFQQPSQVNHASFVLASSTVILASSQRPTYLVSQVRVK